MKSPEDASPLIPLSQGQLNLLETCPRKFQHIYLDQLGTPVSYEQQERLTWGSRFHLLMQQRELGLPVRSLVEGDALLQRWVKALVDAAPEILTPDFTAFRSAEHCRTLHCQGYLLSVVYDLLIEDERSAQILDWKTYPKPKNRKWLAKDWQTRLYLYVLGETSNYLPEQISMSYWFVKSEPRPQSFKFVYDELQHQKTAEDLTKLLTQLTRWWQDYQEKGISFPQVLVSAERCSDCSFAIRCQRTPESAVSSDQDLLLNLGDVQEVPL
ncbi:PD-(D/E)XK nuclease family protein [Lyngbya aestuarii]|uniref:PD-(D/E)XK nuclease family protein n=1 Tax=Lyngbya aestuarii TaxID=118322 RepID=UPI00403DD8B4